MSDRVAVMDHGRVLQIGSPQNIYESPVSAFVANFIGLSNLVEGRIASMTDARCTVSVPDLPTILVRRPGGVVEGSRVTVVLRPERLSLAREVHRNGFDNTVPARIDKTIYNGNEMHYLLRLSNSALWKVRVPNSGAEQKRFLNGEAVFVRWNADEGVVLPNPDSS